MTINTCSQTLPFSIENAFTDRLEGGNPAAIVYLPSLKALPDETLQTIAANFNQPITVFIAPLAPHDANTIDPSSSGGTEDANRTGTTLRFGIRWFTTKFEVALCGHGTLAAAASIFRGARGGAEAEAEGPAAIRFEATSGKFLVARKVEEDRVEIDLDSETAEALSVEEDAKLRGVLAKALGKDVPLKYTGRGAGHLSMYALIEVDTLDLKHLKVNTDAFVSASPWLWGQATLLMNAGLGWIQTA
jgi:predicted PhzF superfamily epimerase YddE/YHI9